MTNFGIFSLRKPGHITFDRYHGYFSLSSHVTNSINKAMAAFGALGEWS